MSKHANTILATLREEWSRKDIINIIQELSDVPLRTTDISRSITIIDESLQDWNRMKFTRRDSILRMGYSETKAMGRKRYATIIKSDVVNVRTGETGTRHTRILHDDPATRGILEKEAEDILVENEVSPDLEIISQEPVQGFVFKG